MAFLPSLLGVVLVVPVAGVLALVAWRRRRRRQEAAQRLRDEEDFELVFPEHPDDKPVRGTVTGRRVRR